MNLVVFDIDGTLVDSVKVDDMCFIQSFRNLHGIDLSEADWTSFKNVTDSGLTLEIFEMYLQRPPSQMEVLELKEHFYQLLSLRKNEITEIDGAISTLAQLSVHPQIAMSFATGGWKETALLKLSAIGYEPEEFPFVSANEYISRASITQQAILEALKRERLEAFNSISIIGDGLWDLETAQNLGINFIGIDHHGTDQLSKAGARNVLNNLTHVEQIIQWITSA